MNLDKTELTFNKNVLESAKISIQERIRVKAVESYVGNIWVFLP